MNTLFRRGSILVHNHPSGRLGASEADLDLTDNVMRIGVLSIKHFVYILYFIKPIQIVISYAII